MNRRLAHTHARKACQLILGGLAARLFGGPQ